MKARRMSTVCSIAQSAERIAWRRAKKAGCLILTFMLIISQISYALPTDPHVEHGQDTFGVKDNTMTVNASDKAVINYGSFNTAPHEAVIINLPSTSSSILNRDIGGNISRLEGLLQSNGLVILVNTAGIYVAPTANINVGGIILSTRDSNTQDFINSHYVFKKISKDELDRLMVVAGTITAAKGGIVGLMAGAINVTKDAKIIVPCGKSMLASGQAIRFDVAADGMISIAIEEKQARKVPR